MREMFWENGEDEFAGLSWFGCGCASSTGGCSGRGVRLSTARAAGVMFREIEDKIRAETAADLSGSELLVVVLLLFDLREFENLVLRKIGSEMEGLVVLGVGMFLAPKKFVESKEVVVKAMVV